MQFHAERGAASGLKLVLRQFPPDRLYSDYLRKMRTAIDEVQTPHLVLVCDDDFHDFTHFEEMDRFLSTNAEYAAVQGEIIDFYLLPNNPFRRVRGEQIEKGVVVSTRRERANSERQSSAVTVGEESFLVRWSAWGQMWPRESVMRVEVASETYRIALESKVFTYRQELPIMRLVCLTVGKYAVAEFATVLKQSNVAGSAGEGMILRHQTLGDYAADLTKTEAEKLMRQRLMEFVFASQKEKDWEFSSGLIRASLDNFLAGQMRPANTARVGKSEVRFLGLVQIWRRLSRRVRSSTRGPIASRTQISRDVHARFSEGFIVRLQAFMKSRP